MKIFRPIAIALSVFIIGCSTDNSLDIEEYWTQSNAYAEVYFSGDVSEVKRSLWQQIRLYETVLAMNTDDWFVPSGGSYGIALCYTRLALIKRAQYQAESSDALFTFALRHWNEWLDMDEPESGREWIMTEEIAQFHIDSLDYEHHVRWREILDSPPVIYYPKFRLTKDGRLEPADAGNGGNALEEEQSP